MLRWLLAICLLSAAHTRVTLGPRELELGWPFGDTEYITISGKFFPWLRTFPNQCMLWNSSCSGNRTEALDEFFNNTGTMMQLVYGAVEYYAQHRVGSGIPPDTNSMIISWLRNPDCRSSLFEWHTENPDQPSWTYSDREDNKDVIRTLNWSSIATNSGNLGCCDACELVGGNVDVYYWPAPAANTECLALVGTTAVSGIDQNLILTDDRGVGGGWWNSQPNPYDITSPTSSSKSTLPYINARGHAILSASENGSQAQSIAVQSGFTFTSPSIYVGFSSLYAVDRCGAIGTFIPYTMLAFAPGELSTIEYPAWDRGNIPANATKSFNFADLPCPPSSVMIADQYKPSPGSPYRPVLSPPQQIYQLQLGWSDCVITHAFAGIDPPKALVPAAALVPNLTPTSPQSQATETTSISSQKPGFGAIEAGNIGVTRDPPPAPAQKVQSTGPRSTASPSSSFNAKVDPHIPESSSKSQDTQSVKTKSQLSSKLQTPIPLQAAPEHTGSESHKGSSIQDLSKDRSFISLIDTSVPKILFDPVHTSRLSSDPRSDSSLTLPTNAVASNPLPTHEEEHEKGTSIPSTQSHSSKDDHGQDLVSSNLYTSPSHGSFPQESSNYLQGTTFTHIADSSADPISASNTARNSDVGSSIRSSTHADPQSSPYNLLPNNQGEHQPQSSPHSSNTNDGLSSSGTVASQSSLEGNPDPLVSVGSTGRSIIAQTMSEPFTSSTSTSSKWISELRSDPSIPSPASIGTNPPIFIEASTTREASTPTAISAPRGSSNTIADPLPPPSITSSDIDTMLPDPNTASVPQNVLLNNTQAITGNETASEFRPSGNSTAGRPAGAFSLSSSTMDIFRGNTTVLPFKSGDERSIASCSTITSSCLYLMFLLLLV